MATFTITQEPTTPNAAYTRLPYVVDASDYNLQPQFQYVMDIYEAGSTNRISRTLQDPNPAGVAVFDPSRIFQGQLSQDDYWKLDGAAEPQNAVKDFVIKFGKQYGTSDSSPVTVYPDLATANITVFQAVVDPNIGSYNFSALVYGKGFPIPDPWLSEAPSARETINNPISFQNSLYFNSSDYAAYTKYEEAGGSININLRSIDESGNVTYLTGAQMYYSGSDFFQTFGIGPKNLMEHFPAFIPYLEAGGLANEVSISFDGPTDSFSYYLTENDAPFGPCSDEYTRFAWINKYGFWDYYNVYNPTRTTTNLTRQNVTLPRVDYSSLLSPYDITRAGDTQYHLSSKDEYTIETDYITKEMATFLEGLIESPTVYMQQGEDFIPIVFTNTSYTANLSTARNKLFKYTFTYKYASGRASRV